MDDRPRYRTLVEAKEYEAQRDFLAERYSERVLSEALTGVLWGIASNPEKYERVFPNIRQARSRSFDASRPQFKIYFEIPDSDRVHLLWIEEITGIEEIERPIN